MGSLFLLPLLPLLLVPFGLKPRTWQYGTLFNVALWSAITLRWKQHPLIWWELLIVAVFSILAFVNVYGDLTPAEFKKGKRPGQGIDYRFENGTFLWRIFLKKPSGDPRENTPRREYP